MAMDRREVLSTALVAGVAVFVQGRDSLAEGDKAPLAPVDGGDPPVWTRDPLEPGKPGVDYKPVTTPNGTSLEFKVVGSVKVFHLVAEPVDHEFAPGLKAQCWGYNGQVHGPTIEVVEGDRVRIYVTNKLSAPTTVHWHGVIVPSGMDGVGGLSQPTIKAGETFKYEFTIHQHGTLMYHAHHDEMTQMAMGLMGLIVVHPRSPKGPRADREFAMLLSEWSVPIGTSRPDPNEMTDFNILTINGKCFPGTAPLVVKQGERIRLRFGNLSSMDHHPIHLHGHSFKIVATDGGDIPESAQWPETTVLVPTGSTRDVELIAANPGDWAMHCHMSHHVMNQMGHGIPNMIGVDPQKIDEAIKPMMPGFMSMGNDGMGNMAEMEMEHPPNSIPMVGAKGPYDYITMGGMFTILKVREELTSNADTSWYKIPSGTSAIKASAEDLKRDGL